MESLKDFDENREEQREHNNSSLLFYHEMKARGNLEHHDQQMKLSVLGRTEGKEALWNVSIKADLAQQSYRSRDPAHLKSMIVSLCVMYVKLIEDGDNVSGLNNFDRATSLLNSIRKDVFDTVR